MKTILVPTDFSRQAGYALDAAHQMAKKLNATIGLVHVLEFPMEDTETPVARVKPLPIAFLKEAKKEAMEQLHAQARLFSITDVPVEYKVQVGNPYLSITRELLKDQVDLVMMGSKGASGLKEIFIGSNAERMVRFAHCPVMVVKDQADLSAINHIVFATTMDEEEGQVLPYLKALQLAYGAHLHLLRVNTMADFLDDPYASGELQRLAERHHLENFSFHTFNDQTEEDGIIHFADQIDADLIALATHGRRGILHLLAGSIAEDVVNHAKRPIWTMSIRK